MFTLKGHCNMKLYMWYILRLYIQFCEDGCVCLDRPLILWFTLMINKLLVIDDHSNFNHVLLYFHLQNDSITLLKHWQTCLHTIYTLNYRPLCLIFLSILVKTLVYNYTKKWVKTKIIMSGAYNIFMYNISSLWDTPLVDPLMVP